MNATQKLQINSEDGVDEDLTPKTLAAALHKLSALGVPGDAGLIIKSGTGWWSVEAVWIPEEPDTKINIHPSRNLADLDPVAIAENIRAAGRAEEDPMAVAKATQDRVWRAANQKVRDNPQA